MKAKVFSVKGEEIRDIELSDNVFGLDISEGSIYYAIRNELANRRVGTACVKTRAEVKGSGTKPWSQKGTGHARSGHKRSPVWVGGGVAFGPKPRDYSYKMPKKQKRLAMKSILSLKAQNNELKIIEDFSVETGKTKDLVGILKNFRKDERTVMILKDDDNLLRRSGSNIPWLKMLSYNRLSAHDLFYCKNLIVLETAAGNLNTFFSTREK